jgi:hypothetical protein
VPARVALSACGFALGQTRANDGVRCLLGSRCRLAVSLWVKPAPTTELGACSGRGVVLRSRFRQNPRQRGSWVPPGSRCRVAVLHGETNAVESVFWAERTGVYVALATQTPVPSSPHPGRTGPYVAPATQQPVLSTTHADNPSHEAPSSFVAALFHPVHIRTHPRQPIRSANQRTIRGSSSSGTNRRVRSPGYADAGSYLAASGRTGLYVAPAT